MPRPYVCPVCYGSGETSAGYYDSEANLDVIIVCLDCLGTGRVWDMSVTQEPIYWDQMTLTNIPIAPDGLIYSARLDEPDLPCSGGADYPEWPLT